MLLNPKDMFRTINNLITTGSCALPAFDSPTLLANDFSDYFSSKVSTTRKDIDELDTVTPSDEIDECPQDCATCMLALHELDFFFFIFH